ncbi:Protein of unknown function [Bacillus mycoides]|nr:Protein of unknown function [Bacillus mycoides]
MLEVSAILQKHPPEVSSGQQHVYLCMSQPL